MRALIVPEPGAEPVLGDLPVPIVTDGTVLVRVQAAALNPIDNVIAAGLLAGSMPHKYPVVLGRDVAGVVEAVGDGVDHVSVGDAVLGQVLLTPPIHEGSLAEFALVSATAVTPRPAGLDPVRAAALPLGASSAVAAIDAVEPEAGQVVLVNGATGGVGVFAVQMLASRSVTVLATGRPDDVERLTALGATAVYDRAVSPVAAQVRADYPDGVDALINLAGRTNDDVPTGAVRRGGKVATLTGSPDADAIAAAGLTGGTVWASPIRDVVGPLAEQAAAGDFEVVVNVVLPLAQALDGLTALGAGHARGKTVVVISD